MNDVVICDLLSNDLDPLLRIVNGSHVDVDRDVLRRASGGDAVVFGLLHEGTLIGKGGVDFLASADAARIWMVNIDEAFRSRGLGTSLMHVLELVSMERGFRHTELLVELTNERAKCFYELRGYRVTGEETDVLYERDDVGEPHRREVACDLMCKSFEQQSKG